MTTFEKLRTHDIPALRTTVEEYVDPASGARHIHLATERADLAFLVGFPTVPDSSDGRAHILEHLALCGSRRYPVRDPFFSMVRRSTASFMNAMTYADRTAYPFASTDRNDFFNLLDVYLDATFFPRLDYLNFLQEGWRYTLEDGKLDYQGVVFNEMKGAFNDPMRALYRGITGGLLAGTTYAVESGGDPLDIPALSHQMLKDFHASHYHPSQAVFMTAGPIAAAEIQQRIAERVLSEHGKDGAPAPRLMPQLASVAAPRQATIAIPSTGGRADEYGVQLAWVLGESADPIAYYHADLLQAGLLGDASAPLRRAMESAGYGRPARINGMDPGARQLLFHVGMEGLTEDQMTSARKLLWDTLEQVAETGVPAATLQAALRDITYDQRDTSGGRMPNVLSRMLNALPVVMRGGDAVSAFDSDAALERLRRDVADPGFFPRLVRGLLDNPARLDAQVKPDPDYFTARAATERERLDAAQAQLTPADLERVTADASALDVLQRTPVDSSVLPRIRPADVSPAPLALPPVAQSTDGKYLFSIPSNGISYARVQFDISALPEDDWQWLALYTSLREDLGVAGKSFEEAGAWRRAQVPRYDIGANAVQESGGSLRLAMNFFAGALREDHAQIAAVLDAYVHHPRFDEEARIRFLIDRMARQRLDGLGQAGDRYAMLAATSPVSPLRSYEQATGGAPFVRFLTGLQGLLAAPDGFQIIQGRLARLHERIMEAPCTLLLAGSGDDAKALAALFDAPRARTGADARDARPAHSQAPANSALFAPSQVNYCHIAWAAPDLRHPDAPALAVAAQLLSHQLLHPALRERGGAYGGFAGYVESAGVFIMSSYRDPRLAGTYADFAASLDALLNDDFSSEQLEEAIISVIQKLDHPASPFDTVLTAWTLHQRGIDLDARQCFRSGVLGCTIDEIKTAAQRWLKAETPSRAASVGKLEQDLAGLDVVDLLKFSKGESTPETQN